MYNILQYLKYFFIKEDRHSLQSPFAYQIYNGLLVHSNHSDSNDIELIRKTFLKDDSILEIKDFGAGSQKLKSSFRKVKDVAHYSNSPKKHNLLYQYFLSLTPALQCIELGTGLGINTQYLAKSTKGFLHTIEGDQGLYDLAFGHLAPIIKVKPLCGNINEILPELLKTIPVVDFALIDANHTYQATVDYFNMLLSTIGEQSIIIIGDIYWSAEMNRAWKEIYKHPEVSLSFDFFECGVLFFRKDLNKAHYIMRY